MDAASFATLLKTVMDNSNKGTRMTACISKPSPALLQLYGPLTDKIAKDKSVSKAIELYDRYMKYGNGGFMWAAVGRLALEVAETEIQATNGSIGILSSIETIQRNSFKALDAVLIEAKIEKTSRIEGFILAVGDAMFLGAVQSIPLVGPLMGLAANTLASNLVNTMVPIATNAVLAGASGTVTPGNSTNGALTLVVTGARAFGNYLDNRILENASASQPYNFNNTNITQNQTAGNRINTLDRAKIATYTQKFVGMFPQDALYQDKDTTIESFRTRTSGLYDGARVMMLDVINAGIKGSFADRISQLPQNDARLEDNHRIALLMVGYFFSKDWEAKDLHKELAVEQNRLAGIQSGPNANVPSAQVALDKAKENIAKIQTALGAKGQSVLAKYNGTSLKRWDAGLKADRLKASQSATQALGLAKTASQTKTGGFILGAAKTNEDRDLRLIAEVEPRVASYLRALKAAMVGDIETVISKSYQGKLLDDTEYKRIWYLYVGSQLILNHTIRELKIKANSFRVGNLFRKITSVNALTIPSNYVDMIRKAGFIVDYPKGFTDGYRVSTAQKTIFANQRKLRWSNNPSNNEQAMLITFCTVVVYTLDIAAITLGLYSWEEADEQLKDVCKKISEAVINNP